MGQTYVSVRLTTMKRKPDVLFLARPGYYTSVIGANASDRSDQTMLQGLLSSTVQERDAESVGIPPRCSCGHESS